MLPPHLPPPYAYAFEYRLAAAMPTARRLMPTFVFILYLGYALLMPHFAVSTLLPPRRRLSAEPGLRRRAWRLSAILVTLPP